MTTSIPTSMSRNDFGRTFRSLAAGLPDSENVFVVTEDRAIVTCCSSAPSCPRMSPPTAAPRGPAQRRPAARAGARPAGPSSRPRALIAATARRSIYVVDIGPLEEANDSILREPAHLLRRMSP